MRTLWHVPLLLALATAAGLGLAFFGDGAGRLVSWLLLVLPLLAMLLGPVLAARGNR